jgi:hypothetical protein
MRWTLVVATLVLKSNLRKRVTIHMAIPSRLSPASLHRRKQTVCQFCRRNGCYGNGPDRGENRFQSWRIPVAITTTILWKWGWGWVRHAAASQCSKMLWEKMIIYGFKINLKTYMRFLSPEKNGETWCSSTVVSALSLKVEPEMLFLRSFNYQGV